MNLKQFVVHLLTLFPVSIIIAFAAILGGCSSLKQVAMEVDIKDILNSSEVFSTHHTGFSLYDIDEDKFISNQNANLLFTPASNTKLLTMYAALSNFSDSIPALLYKKSDSGLFIQPIGDPTFLLHGFDYQPVYDFLASVDSVNIFFNEPLKPYGSGWAWDDYPYAFQIQRSWWPIYGNTVAIEKEDTLVSVMPAFFKDYITISKIDKDGSPRDWYFNTFQIEVQHDTSDFAHHIPFISSNELLLELLADTLKNTNLKPSSRTLDDPDTLYSQQVDTVLKRMLKPSDNFLAEQLLILCAWKNGFTKVEPYIEALKSGSLQSLGEMEWVDGSGLSRYNLISPKSQILLLKKALDEYGWDRLTTILPTGGEGTLEELYLSKEPFIYAKTGTLSNNHNLSGFLVAKSGKKLIFSLMNNHYTRPTEEIKKAMEKLLIQIREAY